MISLLFVQERMLHLPGVSSFMAARERFSAWNRRGMITVCLVGIGASAALCYAATLYWIMGAGFHINAMRRTLDQQQEEVLRQELTLRAQESQVLRHDNPALQAMEKVSRMRFLETDNVAQASQQILRE